MTLTQLRDDLEREFERGDPDKVYRLMDSLDAYIDARIAAALHPKSPHVQTSPVSEKSL